MPQWQAELEGIGWPVERLVAHLDMSRHQAAQLSPRLTDVEITQLASQALAEENESVLWIDPRGRQFKRTEIVPLVFTRVEEWQLLLSDADAPICVHVLRTKTDVLPLDRARHLVLQRMRRLAARKRARAPRRTVGPRLEDVSRRH